MIELLNQYRIARKQSETAAKDLGRAFGKAFAAAYPSDRDVRLARCRNIMEPGEMTIENLKCRVLGSVGEFAQAFGEVIWRDPTTSEWSVGLGFPQDSRLVRRECCNIKLHEPLFVEGFMEGFQAPMDKSSTPRNGSPALVNGG